MRREGIILRHLSEQSAIIQDTRSGEEIFVFADDCSGDRLPGEGVRVTYLRLGYDMAEQVRINRPYSKIA